MLGALPGIKCAARRASGCPFRRAGALVKLVLRGGRGVAWLGLSAPLKCCSAIPRAVSLPLLLGTQPGIKRVARRASDCPSGRAGALVVLVLRGKRGGTWQGLSASLGCFMRHPTGRRAPSVDRQPDRSKCATRRANGKLIGALQAPLYRHERFQCDRSVHGALRLYVGAHNRASRGAVWCAFCALRPGPETGTRCSKGSSRPSRY